MRDSLSPSQCLFFVFKNNFGKNFVRCFAVKTVSFHSNGGFFHGNSLKAQTTKNVCLNATQWTTNSSTWGRVCEIFAGLKPWYWLDVHETLPPSQKAGKSTMNDSMFFPTEKAWKSFSLSNLSLPGRVGFVKSKKTNPLRWVKGLLVGQVKEEVDC